MRQCNLYEAKTKLSQLVQAALDGEEVFIARADKVAARLVPVVAQQPATGGWEVLNIDPAATADLPAIHANPFDRIILAQARYEHLTLLKAPPLSGYP